MVKSRKQRVKKGKSKLSEEEIERLEDEEDVKAVLKARRDLKSGKTTTISLEDLMKKYGME